MITANYLFSKKIIWFGEDLICANKFPYFKDELLAVLNALLPKNEMGKIMQNLVETERTIEENKDCICYIRFFKREGNYDYSYYAGGENELEDARLHYEGWIYEDNFEPLEWSELIGGISNVDVEDIFNKLDESFDRTLIGKQIWFDYPTERSDIETVNQFLIDNGFRGLTPDNINEFEDFIYDHDVAFFYMIQHDSPLHSEERRKPYVDYSYMNYPNPYKLKEKPNWIYYKDILKMGDITSDFIVNLNESTTPTPKVGDFLYCHTDLIMEDDGDREATKGKFYSVVDVNRYKLDIINNSKGHHSFDLHPKSDSYYGKWFELVPRQYRQEFENFNPDDFLKSIE